MSPCYTVLGTVLTQIHIAAKWGLHKKGKIVHTVGSKKNPNSRRSSMGIIAQETEYSVNETSRSYDVSDIRRLPLEEQRRIREDKVAT